MKRADRTQDERPDSGATLVEIAIATLIASMLVFVLWSIFSADQKRFFVDQNRLSGLQGALLLDDYLSADLERMIVFHDPSAGDREPRREEFIASRPVTIVEAGRKVTFLSFKGQQHEPGLIVTTRVSYYLDAKTSRVVRQVGSKITPFGSLIAEELSFQLVPLAPRFGGLGLSPPRYTVNQTARLAFLKYRISCISELVQDAPAGQHGPEERVNLVGSVPLLYRANLSQHDYWVFSGQELPDEPDRPE